MLSTVKRLPIAFSVCCCLAAAQSVPPPPPLPPDAPAAAQSAAPAAPQQPDVAWPRTRKAEDGTTIDVYQPQLERWADNVLSGRAAVALTRPGEKEQHFGVIEITAKTQVDKSADVVTLTDVRITKSTFPTATPQQTAEYLATLRARLPKDGWRVSLDAVQANLGITQAQSKQKSVTVKNDPPQILFSTVPAMLVLIDGEPALREVKESPGLKRVINTTALILVDQAAGTYYLWAVGKWWEAKTPTGDWRPSASAPASKLDPVRDALLKAQQVDPLEGKYSDGKPAFDPGVTPVIRVATKPTELLQSKGEPQYSPVPGTQLLYATNSPNDIFFDVTAQNFYVLISGRWFSAKNLSGPWSYVASKSLPPDFARIPANHPMGDTLTSVANTPQAREAAIASQVPQTAQVQRDVQPTPIAYDGGAPQWKPIDGTPLSYAFNTGAAVIQVDAKTYYMVQNGVWFVATAPAGPWVVATTVPVVIYTIPPSSPVHYVTYVRVYGSTPTVVYVGYTPGYYGTVLTTDGVVVYGTGYVYPVYIGTVWYPPPPTYGFGAGFAFGVWFGFAMGPYPAPWHVGGCCWGGGGGMRVYNNITVNNYYGRWGSASTATGPGGRSVGKAEIGQTTFAKGSGSNNVYAGRDGNVYRRDESSGQWQKYQGSGSWSDMNRPEAKPEPRQNISGETRRDTPSQGNLSNVEQRNFGGDTQRNPGGDTQRNFGGETQRSLDQNYQARSAGDRGYQSFQGGGGARGGGGFSGGGGMRGGGGGRR